MTTPILRAIHHQLDGPVEVHYLTKKKFSSILQANPYVQRIHTIEKSVQEVLPQLEEIGFDYIIDLHRNIRSRIVKRRLKVLDFTFRKYNFEKWLWVNFRINKMPHEHIVDRYRSTLKAFGVKDDGQGLEYYIPEGSGIQLNHLSPLFHQPYIAFAIGAMHIGKRLSADKIVAICQQSPLPVVLLGGTEDSETAAHIAMQCGSKVYNAVGQFTLHESADCIQKSEVVITGDTGLMHIASAFQKKILSLWGCTVPGFGMYPYRPHPASILLEPKNRNRRPCSKLGNRCKYGVQHRCIEQIEIEVIAQSLKELITTPQTTPLVQ